MEMTNLIKSIQNVVNDHVDVSQPIFSVVGLHDGMTAVLIGTLQSVVTKAIKSGSKVFCSGVPPEFVLRVVNSTPDKSIHLFESANHTSIESIIECAKTHFAQGEKTEKTPVLVVNYENLYSTVDIERMESRIDFQMLRRFVNDFEVCVVCVVNTRAQAGLDFSLGVTPNIYHVLNTSTGQYPHHVQIIVNDRDETVETQTLKSIGGEW